ncbi:MAG: serine hydrolase domain-containing protein, partial [Gemmatimonadales bacterium]
MMPSDRAHGTRASGWSLLVLLLAGAALACAPRSSGPGAASPVAVFPGAVWDSITNPRAAGWSPEWLDSVRGRLSKLPSTGFVAVAGGRVLFTYGDVDTITYLASVRKSVLSMHMGNYVRRGTIDLGKTLADLGMDDIGG